MHDAAATLTAQYNNLDSVREVFAANKGEIAGVILEPVVGNSGYIAPTQEFLQVSSYQMAACMIPEQVHLFCKPACQTGVLTEVMSILQPFMGILGCIALLWYIDRLEMLKSLQVALKSCESSQMMHFTCL